MTDELLAAAAIKLAIIGRDEDITALGETSHVPADRIAHYLANRCELDPPELERITKALWGDGARLVHGRVRLAALP